MKHIPLKKHSVLLLVRQSAGLVVSKHGAHYSVFLFLKKLTHRKQLLHSCLATMEEKKAKPKSQVSH